MIKKESIKKTAICYWSNEDEAYVVESPLFPRTAGIGHTTEAAQKHFEDILDGIYNQLTDNKVRGYNKRGRPTKGGIQFHTQVRPKTKTYLAKLSKQLDISLGEVLDYLCTFYNVINQQKQLPPHAKKTASTYPKLIENLTNLISIMKQEQKDSPLLLKESQQQKYRTSKPLHSGPTKKHKSAKNSNK